MEEMIKLIWDFRGSDSEMTAVHHAKHLKTFATQNELDSDYVKTQVIDEQYSTAFIVVPRSKMIMVRDSLRPHRGELA